MSCMKDQRLDGDDVFGNTSRISCDRHKSTDSACNSNSEYCGPISVRHMIQRYNNQFKQSAAKPMYAKNSTFKINSSKRYNVPSHHLLPSTESSYCGLNYYGSFGNCQQFAAPTGDDERNHNQIGNDCCKNCTAFACCRNRSRISSSTTKMLSSTLSSLLEQQSNENNEKPKNQLNMEHKTCDNCIRSSDDNCTRILLVENCSNISDDINAITTNASNNAIIVKDVCAEPNNVCSSNDLHKINYSQNVVEEKKNRLQPIDSVEDDINTSQQQPDEASYKSNTTIAKTSSGVRIIVDIFFDQERCVQASDIVGSRVVTDLPQSRILHEFQQQKMLDKTNGSSNRCV